MVATIEHFREKLSAVQTAAKRLRCEAFVDYTPVVAGQRLEQITLPSYNRLCAFDCAFAVGGPLSFEAIICFIWVQHPSFGQFNLPEKLRVTHEVWRALNPRFAGVQMLVRMMSPVKGFRWLARFRRPLAAELQVEAVTEIKRLIHEALHDFPAGDESEAGPDGATVEPMPFAFQAQILNLFRRSLGLSFAETRSIPLKAVAQHLREVLHVESKGKATMLTREETKVWIEYHAWKQDRANADRLAALSAKVPSSLSAAESAELEALKACTPGQAPRWSEPAKAPSKN